MAPVTTADGTFQFSGEQVPAEATITARRRSQSLLGLGLVDAVPDATWFAIAEEEQAADPSTAGRVQLVFDPATGGNVVGRFGWKAQLPTLRRFAGDALLNEMGITSPGFRDEVCPQGDCLALGFNPAPALNDDGRDVAALTDFMTMLAAPLRGPITDEANAGEIVFQQIGCGAHVIGRRCSPARARFAHSTARCSSPGPTFCCTTWDSWATASLKGWRPVRRCAPRHCGGFISSIVTCTTGRPPAIEDAILRHDGQGSPSRSRFDGLNETDRAALLAFLNSL